MALVAAWLWHLAQVRARCTTRRVRSSQCGVRLLERLKSLQNRRDPGRVLLTHPISIQSTILHLISAMASVLQAPLTARNDLPQPRAQVFAFNGTPRLHSSTALVTGAVLSSFLVRTEIVNAIPAALARLCRAIANIVSAGLATNQRMTRESLVHSFLPTFLVWWLSTRMASLHQHRRRGWLMLRSS